MPFNAYKKLQKSPLKPLMALIGNETLIQKKMRENLIERALGDALQEMNLSQFQIGEHPMNRILDACRDFPCFAEKRVVILADIHRLKKKGEVEEFLTYLNAPQTSTVLILEGEKLDGRLQWVKTLKKQGEIFEIPEAKTPDAIAWVQRCFRKEGQAFAMGIPEILVEWVGTSLTALEQTVIQVCLFVDGAGEVNRSHLETLLIKVSEENIFALMDALFSKNLKQLYDSLNRLLNSGEAPLKILALLHRHLNILLAIKTGEDRNSSPLLRLPPFALRQYEAQARRFAPKLNFGLLKPITEADYRLKSSSLAPSLNLKYCVESVVHALN